jgi:hypothetical protein
MIADDPEQPERWPQGGWFALADGADAPSGTAIARLRVVDAGNLVLPHGQLGACDPFAGLDDCTAWVDVARGRYAVKVTVADVSPELDGSYLREAYATVLLDPDAEEVSRRVLGDADPGQFRGFPVDAGTACFVDVEAIEDGMPDPTTWHEALFETPGGWFDRMDDPSHLAAGIANLPLPESDNSANIVLMRSGWGDGVYPVIGGYDRSGRLVRVHIDFFVVGSADEVSETPDDRPGDTLSRERTDVRPRSTLPALAGILLPTGAWLALSFALDAPVAAIVLGGAAIALVATGILAWRGMLL